MVKREVKDLLPTMKVKVDEGDELAIPFEELQAQIINIADIETSFGKKVIATLESGEKQFCVFVNATSMGMLIESYGDNDENWKGKLVNLSLEKNTKFKNKMILLNPVA